MENLKKDKEEKKLVAVTLYQISKLTNFSELVD